MVIWVIDHVAHARSPKSAARDVIWDLVHVAWRRSGRSGLRFVTATA